MGSEMCIRDRSQGRSAEQDDGKTGKGSTTTRPAADWRRGDGIVSDRGAPSAERAIRKLTVAALGTILLLGGVMGGLAATTRLSGAVIASGTVVVDSYVKPVQHQKGGTVGQIFVKNGDLVEAGQVLIHLDDTQTRANLAIVRKRLDELWPEPHGLKRNAMGRIRSSFPKIFLRKRTTLRSAARLKARSGSSLTEGLRA